MWDISLFPQLTPQSLTIYRLISATDLDEGNNRQIFYSLADDPNSPVSQFISIAYQDINKLWQHMCSFVDILEIMFSFMFPIWKCVFKWLLISWLLHTLDLNYTPVHFKVN